ncbi:hypothetical protein C8Q75DRAFT_805675 [Abortiporus biennis]|nr:hypothetical protein C8Q75DRAFT_805675 [Abortiporus biennis]
MPSIGSSAPQRAVTTFPISFDNTLGAVFIGLLVATFLTGLGTHQTYVYYLNTGKKDRIALRIYIGFLWFLDILLLVLASTALYNYLITNYANTLALPAINWATAAYLATAAVLHFLVRWWVVYVIQLRNHLLKIIPVSSSIVSGKVRYDKLYLGLALMALNCVVIGVGLRVYPIYLLSRASLKLLCVILVAAVRFHQIGNFFKLDEVKSIAICAFATIACLDTLIAILLSFMLWMKKGHATHRTSSQIDILMRYIIHTGVLTSVCAISVLVTILRSIRPTSGSNAWASFQLSDLSSANCESTTNADKPSALVFGHPLHERNDSEITDSRDDTQFSTVPAIQTIGVHQTPSLPDTSSTTLPPHPTGSMSNTSNSSNNQSKDRVASKVRPSRIKPDFKLDSYSIDNPPPLISRQHSRKEFRVAHSDTLSMLIGLSILYLLDELQQELYCSRPDDHTILIIFYSGTNSSAASLKRALNPERIAFVQKVLGIDKPPAWIIAT